MSEIKRLNVNFSRENYDFIKSVAYSSGHTMNQLVNLIVDQYRVDHAELAKSAEAFGVQIDRVFTAPPSYRPKRGK